MIELRKQLRKCYLHKDRIHESIVAGGIWRKAVSKSSYDGMSSVCSRTVVLSACALASADACISAIFAAWSIATFAADFTAAALAFWRANFSGYSVADFRACFLASF